MGTINQTISNEKYYIRIYEKHRLKRTIEVTNEEAGLAELKDLTLGVFETAILSKDYIATSNYGVESHLWKEIARKKGE